MTRFHSLLLASATMLPLNTPALAQSACDTGLPIALPEACAEISVTHPIKGLHNFRELTTPDAGIRPGILFRSDQLDEVSDADLTYLTEPGIETVVDLRAPEELDSHPNKHIPSVDFTANLPIGSDPADIRKIMPLDVAAQIRPLWFEGKFHDIDALLADHDVNLRQTRIDRYEDFATDFNPQVSRFLHMLTNADNFPLVFHCAGGKDRTGFLSAVTMLVLGYSDEDVMREYLTTNLFIFEDLEQMVGHGPESLRPAFGAHPEQIRASLAKIREDHGSFENYRRDILGISDAEVEAIRQNLLISG